MNDALDAARWLSVLALVAARVLPVVVWLPAFGGRALPWALRVGLGAAVATFIALRTSALPAAQDALLALDATTAAGFVRLFVMAAREVAVGLTLAFAASVVFMAAQMAGRLTDLARRADGEAMALPFANDDSGHSSFSALYILLAALIFAEIGGPGHVVTALVRTYELLPLTGLRGQGAPLPLVSLVARIVGGSIEVAVALAAPVVLAVWLSELCFALVARLTGARAMGAEAMPSLASGVGLAMALLALGIVRAGLEGWLAEVPAVLLRTAEAWARG